MSVSESPNKTIDQFTRGRYSRLPGLWRLIPHRHYYTMTVSGAQLAPDDPYRAEHVHGYQCLRCWRQLSEVSS